MPDTQDQVSTTETAQAAGSQTTTETTEQGAAQAAATEKVFTEDYVKRLRAENANYRTKLSALEEASKTEAQRLTEKAALADELSPKVERYQAAISSQVEEMKSALSPEMAALMPEGDPVAQLDWLKKAAKVKPAGDLPAAGTRNPAGGGAQAAKQVGDRKTFDELAKQIPALRGRTLRT